jgi:dGTPase
MRARIINSKNLMQIDIFAQARESINAKIIEDHTIRRTRTAKAMMNKLICDCIETSKEKITSTNIQSLEDIYSREENLITISSESDRLLTELEQFLMQNLYLNDQVKSDEKVKKWLDELFGKICDKPDIMPGYYQSLIKMQGLQRSVCDYIAGMTDRYCIETVRTFQS